jgi:acyl carrier protein
VADVARAIREFIVREFMNDSPGMELGDDEPLIKDGIIDSLGIFMIVGFLEQAFGVRVRPEDVTVENFASVTSITRLVAVRQTAPAPPVPPGP